MKILTIHSDFIEVEPKQKAIADADEIHEKFRQDEALVVFTAAEEQDSIEISETLADEAEKVAEQVKAKNLVLYPYVHLTNKPASPRLAKKILDKALELLERKGFNVKKAPFGWYKAFTIKAKGHPLSELSRDLSYSSKQAKKTVEDISESLKQEDELTSKFFILTPEGELLPFEKYDYSKSEKFGKMVNYETKKSRIYEKAPPHIKIMQEQELVDYEPGSDSGNFRFYPKGKIIKKLLEKSVSELCIGYGANEVETPIMYDFEHPSLKKYMNRFPARQYVVLSDEKKLFLRFAACFGQFLIAHDAVISHKQLPLKMYELTRYSFRREQGGELAGLKRLRAFTMPDMHTITKDIEMAKSEFEIQLEKSLEWLAKLNLRNDIEVAFRAQKDFYEENKEWYQSMVRKIGKPILVELFNQRYAYFITKFEFNVIDSMDKASTLSTVQIDVENSETYDINFIDEKGEKKKPLILHASFSGSLERVIYALLEKEAENMEKGKKAMFPVWLSPVQLRLIPISNEKHLKKCIEISEKLQDSMLRFDIDDRDETLSKKIRSAEKEWIPYIAVIGDKELESGKLSITIRETGEKKEFSIDAVTKEIEEKNRKEVFEKLTFPIEMSKRPIFRAVL